ncbi:hypothetical protein HO173_011157 [Letharia columbiana]|uniref:Uncharacterized protein n=1 Tax=Letharia columbiana TaxID=112416 RepID=A0A8H6FL95_9LECA|nr:uncharacterized protein HO173_011157 [Letharia columbiana]KAF6230620.1 hypothetical protein HO173_011157 [Letharia columbiana]
MVFTGFNKTYSLYLAPTAGGTSVPFPYLGYVGINFGLNTDGFSEVFPGGGHLYRNDSQILVSDFPDMANQGTWYEVCQTLIPWHEAAGLQDQVFWLSNKGPAGGTPNCTISDFFP